jgi:hypothetical protein
MGMLPWRFVIWPRCSGSCAAVGQGVVDGAERGLREGAEAVLERARENAPIGDGPRAGLLRESGHIVEDGRGIGISNERSTSRTARSPSASRPARWRRRVAVRAHADPQVNRMVRGLLDNMHRRRSTHLDLQILERVMLEQDCEEHHVIAAMDELLRIKAEIERRRVN